MGIRLKTGIQAIRAQGAKTLFPDIKKFSESLNLEFKVPSNTTSKRAIIRIRGTTMPTYTSTAPLIDERGIGGRIFSLCQVTDGNDVFKNIDWFMHRRLSHLVNGSPPNRRFGTAATAALALAALAECPLQGAPFVMPTSGQYIAFEETLQIDFEDAFAYMFGRQASIWPTTGNVSARIKLLCGSLKRLHLDSYAGDCSYSNTNIDVSVTIVDVEHVEEDPAAPFMKIRENLIPFDVAAGATRQPIEISRQSGKLLGMGILVYGSDANKVLSDTAVKTIQLKGSAKGSRDFYEVGFMDGQALNVDSFGITEKAMVAGRHPMHGFCYLNLRQDGDNSDFGLPIDQLSTLFLNFDTSGPNDTPSESGRITGLIMTQVMTPA